MTEQSESRRIVIKGDKFKIARIFADAKIPFIFVRMAGKNTVGDIPTGHIRATEKLLEKYPELEGRYAKNPARRKTKKKITRKKTTRRKNPAKKNYLVFKQKGNEVSFMVLRGSRIGWSFTKGESILFQRKYPAESAAKTISKNDGWQYGVAPSTVTVVTILKTIRGKA